LDQSKSSLSSSSSSASASSSSSICVAAAATNASASAAQAAASSRRCCSNASCRITVMELPLHAQALPLCTPPLAHPLCLAAPGLFRCGSVEHRYDVRQRHLLLRFILRSFRVDVELLQRRRRKLDMWRCNFSKKKKSCNIFL
jgi:hypothetical protein